MSSDVDGESGEKPHKCPEKRKVMFKFEDIRKDYLILTMVKIMGELLYKQFPELRECLTIYKVVPTGSEDGFIEFVNAHTIYHANMSAGSEITTIQNFLLRHPDNLNTSFHDVRRRYVLTMAFWSVATLLLGVGDRHANNIMIKPNGCIFHIDYGFILGNDPKVLSTLLPFAMSSFINILQV